MTQYKLITALCRGGGIGYKGGLPWPNIARDMRFFAKTTKPNTIDGSIKTAVLMGRKTWDSLPLNAKPLKNRDNIIISSSSTNGANTVATDNSNIIHINHIDQLKSISHKYDVIWIIGGSSVYEQCICNNDIVIDEIHITFINSNYEFDTKFPELSLHHNTHHNTVNEDMGSMPFNWIYVEVIPSYVTFVIDPCTQYSIETIDLVTESPDCPELRFLKFSRIIQDLTP